MFLVAATAAPVPAAAPTLVCKTTVQVDDSSFTIELRPDWAPAGVERFLVQFGISTSAEKQRHWQSQGNIRDDPRPAGVPFTDGILSFAGYGTDSRSTHLFITLGSQPGLGHRQWEVPVGRVVSGMPVVRAIYSGYGDAPDQGRMQPDRPDAAKYLADKFPKMDRIVGQARGNLGRVADLILIYVSTHLFCLKESFGAIDI
ncbi:hypothetical protein EMIHUDRAFT_207779 [Emiliania huxleyi CCMP1516]|uniref:PPIase cyclophilin-type domain-containing protein n=2 Tax=Emiliania huxleyi TaxID=2903 RepID=A0A0D3JDZ0_EMIH1|nr:hypothetical protein EMIHUDRAFT_207779 [Emiliania huxleyi CCMP1516]EOD21725.1 hypothetical protein EMIHUDRAFT_207779 [Emiliania huxleyi CCMP1516]|eukprot:XP_005774154.1 hypothetical protein EMIHUDRAFT_207779 [Emiliania huxleyi CCMP1516]